MFRLPPTQEASAIIPNSPTHHSLAACFMHFGLGPPVLGPARLGNDPRNDGSGLSEQGPKIRAAPNRGFRRAVPRRETRRDRPFRSTKPISAPSSGASIPAPSASGGPD